MLLEKLMAKQNDSIELQIYCNSGPSLIKKTKPEGEICCKSGSSLIHNTTPGQGRERYLQLLKLLFCKINVAYRTTGRNFRKFRNEEV